MTKFNPENKFMPTYADLLEPAMKITDPEDAKQYYDAYLVWQENHTPKNGKYTAEEIVKQNLGYYAGYYSNETRARVEKLFNCAHPFFGSIEENVITNEQAFEIGLKLGLKHKKVNNYG